MITRAPFGRTGHASTRVIFGAAALSRVDQETADEVLSIVERNGINHIDTAAMYGDSEIRLASWLSSHRPEVFLATKTVERGGAGARSSLERSLERMGVEYVDSIQLHNLVEEDEWQEAHGPEGAVEALIQAREEGLCRHIGVTGHGLRIPRMHLRSLERHDFDSVLFPLNYPLFSMEGYRQDAEELLGVCRERGVAVQTIKSIARRRWPPDTTEKKRSWYQPLEDAGALRRAVHYVLSVPDVFLCSSSDFERLPDTLAAAAAFAGAPGPSDLESDSARLQVSALFDGEALERI